MARVRHAGKRGGLNGEVQGSRDGLIEDIDITAPTSFATELERVAAAEVRESIDDMHIEDGRLNTFLGGVAHGGESGDSNSRKCAVRNATQAEPGGPALVEPGRKRFEKAGLPIEAEIVD